MEHKRAQLSSADTSFISTAWGEVCAHCFPCKRHTRIQFINHVHPSTYTYTAMKFILSVNHRKRARKNCGEPEEKKPTVGVLTVLASRAIGDKSCQCCWTPISRSMQVNINREVRTLRQRERLERARLVDSGGRSRGEGELFSIVPGTRQTQKILPPFLQGECSQEAKGSGI